MIISEDDLDIEHQAPEPEPEPVPELTKSEPIGHNPFRRGLIDVFTVLGVEIPEEFKVIHSISQLLINNNILRNIIILKNILYFKCEN